MTNALEAFWENVKQEATDELRGSECHGLASTAVAAVLPAKLNRPVIKVEQPVVGDGNAVGVACDVSEHLPRSAEGGFGIHHPICLPHGGDVEQEDASRPQQRHAGKEL